MKKTLTITGIVVFLMIPIFATPVLGTTIKEGNFNDLEIESKLLLSIGRVNYNPEEKIICGFVLIGFNAGKILTAEKININYEGIPLVVTNGLFFTFCFYKPVVNST